MSSWPVHGRVTGPIVMIGFGSIGRGTLPLIERHFDYDQRAVHGHRSRRRRDRQLLDERGVRFIQHGADAGQLPRHPARRCSPRAAARASASTSRSTPPRSTSWSSAASSARSTSTPSSSPGPASISTRAQGPEARTNYALRESDAGRAPPRRRAAPTAVSCCGANPGMVSWFVKQALLNLASRPRRSAHDEPKIARGLGAADAASSASRASTSPSATRSAPRSESRCSVFVNTWSVEGFVSRGHAAGRARLGHARDLDAGRTAARHETGCGAAIYLLQPGANTRVRSWTPTAQAQYGFLVTHNEAISIADYLHRPRGRATVVYRPTCHYAYHPCNDAVLSLHEMFGQAGKVQERAPHPRRARDRRRHRRTRRPALRPRQERLLVRLAALDRGDARARALPERHRPAGDLGGARRHGLGAGEPEGRHRRGRRDGLPPLPRGADALSRPGHRRLHRLDAARRPPRACSRRTSTPSDPWQFRNVLVR